MIVININKAMDVVVIHVILIHLIKLIKLEIGDLLEAHMERATKD